MRNARLLVGVLSALVLLGRGASAQNLVVNSTFNTDLAGWTNYGSGLAADGARAWAPFPDDSSATPTSGSALMTLTTTAAAGVQIGLSQCVAVTAGATYSFGARFKTPTGQTTGEVRGLMELAFFSDGACATPLNLGEGQGAVVGIAYPLSDTVWPALPGTAPATPGSAPAPPTSQSARVSVFVERVSGNQAQQVLFDGVFVNDAASTPVSLTTFTAE